MYLVNSVDSKCSFIYDISGLSKPPNLTIFASYYFFADVCNLLLVKFFVGCFALYETEALLAFSGLIGLIF